MTFWLMTLALLGGDKPNWMKWDAAKALAKQTGMPIIVYNTVDKNGGGC
jgi:hypothetical protein